MIYAMNHEEVLFYQAFSIQISCLIDQRIVTLGSKLNYFSISHQVHLRNQLNLKYQNHQLLLQLPLDLQNDFQIMDFLQKRKDLDLIVHKM